MSAKKLRLYIVINISIYFNFWMTINPSDMYNAKPLAFIDEVVEDFHSLDVSHKHPSLKYMTYIEANAVIVSTTTHKWFLR